MIALIDYGVGNLRSVEKALNAVGAHVLLTSEPGEVQRADRVVLPGVGAFGDGMAGLRARGLVEVLHDIVRRQIPLLGICLGMQLLFDGSDEADGCPGLGLLPGRVHRFSDNDLKVPHTGWNQVYPEKVTPLLNNLAPGCYAYFNHSYYCNPAVRDNWLGTTEYGQRYASVVGQGQLYGVQFHPEKSQSVGLQILANFLGM